MKISIIVAYGNQRQIGVNNKLLWSLKDDLQNFKKITLGHHILMGRKTFDSIGRALPGRTSLVLSRNLQQKFPQGVHPFSEFSEAQFFAKNNGEEELFIIGGGEIYKMALPFATRLYVSAVDYSEDADTYFPKWDESQYSLVNSTEFPKNGSAPKWILKVYDRKSS